MEKLIFFLLAMLSFATVQAQIFTDEGRYELFGKDDPNLFKATGSPYLTENFIQGKIFFEGKPVLSVPLRYNIYTGSFEIKLDPDRQKIYKVNDWEKAIYELDGKKFISSELDHDGGKIKGFFIEHYTGNQYSLLEKPEIEVVPPVRSDSGYSEDQPAKLKKSSSFYIVDRGGEIIEVKLKRRDIRKAFSSAAARDYLSDNKIKEVEDLVAFLAHLEK